MSCRCFFVFLCNNVYGHTLHAACGGKRYKNMTNEKNPLMMPYGTPHDTAPFGKISIADFEEAMLEGIRRDNEQIDRICSDEAEPSTC